MTRTPEGVKVQFKNGEVFVNKDMILEASVSKTEGGAEEKPPPDAAEKEAQGFVRFEGKWIKKEQRDKLLEERRVARADKIKKAMDHRDWRNRYKKATANFEFEYTIDPEVMNDFSALMEEYYKRFLAEWKIVKPPNMGKLKVCFYHDQDLYYQVSGAPRGAIGYFRFVKPIELNFYFDRNDRELTLLVMFHETNHYLTHLIDPDFHYPIWINESLAEYYGASQWDPVKKQMAVGFLQEGRLTSIQDDILNDKWQDLEQLIRLTQGEFGADKYAWGWSFVHYLLENKKYAQKFKNFYVALAREKSVKTTRSPGMVGAPTRSVEPDEVIRVLLQYLGVKDLKVAREGVARVREGPQADVRPRLRRGRGDVHDVRDADQGEALLRDRDREGRQARESSTTGSGKALLMKADSDFEAAEAAFKNAIAADPLNGEYYAELARTIERKTKDPKNAEVVRLRSLALEVDPDNSELLQKLSRDEALKKAFDVPKEGAESKPKQ